MKRWKKKTLYCNCDNRSRLHYLGKYTLTSNTSIVHLWGVYLRFVTTLIADQCWSNRDLPSHRFVTISQKFISVQYEIVKYFYTAIYQVCIIDQQALMHFTVSVEENKFKKFLTRSWGKIFPDILSGTKTFLKELYIQSINKSFRTFVQLENNSQREWLEVCGNGNGKEWKQFSSIHEM